MSITVEYVDGRTEEVNVPPVSQVAFEREHKMPLANLGDEPYLMHSYWLAWHGSTAGRQDRPSFEDWLDTVAGLGDGDGGDVAPLDQTASFGPSLPQPSSPVRESPSPS